MDPVMVSSIIPSCCRGQGDDRYTQLHMLKVLITTMGDDRYTQLHMLKVLITTMGDDRYTQLHMLKVLITTMGDDRYTIYRFMKLNVSVSYCWSMVLLDHSGFIF